MSTPEIIQEAASRLRAASDTRQACSPVRDLIGDSDQDAAYKVQAVNNAIRLAEGAQPVGKKIGLTSPAVQQQLGVDQPDYGLLFDDMAFPNEGTIPWDHLMQPKIEAEVAFVMGADLPDGEVTMEQLVEAIGEVRASLEIVGSRIENWNIRITDTIADNAAASQYVLGPEKVPLSAIDVANCRMTMQRNGEEASAGTGHACMGSPLNAALWLAQTMARNGQPLHKGDVLLSGALGPMVPIAPGDHFTAEISGLGQVSINIGHQF